MCKLAFNKTKDGKAYSNVLKMLEYQEHKVAGHSTGVAWIDSKGVHLRKAIGKVINFKADYPDTPKTNICLGHSRYATVGEINFENQHPSGIRYNGKRVGYAIHNGGWKEYKMYEHHRNPNIKNITDSALMFHIYGIILEKYNANTKEGRIKTLATLQKFLSKGQNNIVAQNFIFMFDDGQVLFCGDGLDIHPLTYLVTKDNVSIMSFGLDTDVHNNKIYEVVGYDVVEHDMVVFPNFRLSKKEVESDKNLQSCECDVCDVQKTLGDYKSIDKKKFKKVAKFNTSHGAKRWAELLKKRDKLRYYRIIEEKNKFYLYINRSVRK